jgi:hypothetical protein
VRERASESERRETSATLTLISSSSVPCALPSSYPPFILRREGDDDELFDGVVLAEIVRLIVPRR